MKRKKGSQFIFLCHIPQVLSLKSVHKHLITCILNWLLCLQCFQLTTYGFSSKFYLSKLPFQAFLSSQIIFQAMGIVSCCSKAAGLSLLILIIPLSKSTEQIDVITVQIFLCSTRVKTRLIIDQYLIAFIQCLNLMQSLNRCSVCCL